VSGCDLYHTITRGYNWTRFRVQIPLRVPRRFHQDNQDNLTLFFSFLREVEHLFRSLELRHRGSSYLYSLYILGRTYSTRLLVRYQKRKFYPLRRNYFLLSIRLFHFYLV